MNKYEEQLNRVKRYYNRFKKLNQGQIHSSGLEEYLDDIYAFFQNCYHLKDYLKNDQSYTKHSAQEIEKYVNETEALAICADICNGLKHLSLNRVPRSGNLPKISQEKIALTFRDSLRSPKVEPSQILIKIEIEHGNKKIDAFDLATKALKSWETFIY